MRLDQDDALLHRRDLALIRRRRKSGGALLGDRIRMNAIGPMGERPARLHAQPRHARGFGSEISRALPDVLAACKCAGFDLIVVETSAASARATRPSCRSWTCRLYVMTPEYGAASQLEKIDMLDFAEFVAINKFDRKGAADALRDVAKQVQRNREAWKHAMPDARCRFSAPWPAASTTTA